MNTLFLDNPYIHNNQPVHPREALRFFDLDGRDGLAEARAYAKVNTWSEDMFLVKVYRNQLSDTFHYLFMTSDRMTEDGYVFLPSGNLWSPKGYQDGSVIEIVHFYQLK